jgi:hypothetical protein
MRCDGEMMVEDEERRGEERRIVEDVLGQNLDTTT